jgi:hypothetical protein
MEDREQWKKEEYARIKDIICLAVSCLHVRRPVFEVTHDVLLYAPYSP